MPLPSLKTDPKSLGIVQIMNGVVIFLFGVALRSFYPLSVNSGAVYWGSFCVKSSLVMNLLSILAAVIVTIMLCVDLVHMSVELKPCYDVTDKDCLFIIMFGIIRNIFRMLVVFSVLEVCMAIWTFVLVWKSRDNIEAMP
ncbi:hypothetical protein QTP70_032296 [Hemibagrus guttatus]|uniref:Uncharacterized protein n=1 Tax=Hemibagrus guttatus TaxID=175788 RepID=A0AAE0RK47_9TELE|nr:hypothetical protein QTP70_032296 [Hemibagrus guttatus]KAK3575384.1 hypothetical protein QTP86_025783 [Hemibagrus guttatus]